MFIRQGDHYSLAENCGSVDPSLRACMKQVIDLLVGGGSYSLHRHRKEASKLVLLHAAARFQLALVSQWTVVTILGLHSRDGTGQ